MWTHKASKQICFLIKSQYDNKVAAVQQRGALTKWILSGWRNEKCIWNQASDKCIPDKKKMHTLWTLSVYKDLKVNARPWSMPLFEHACHKTMSNMLHCTWKGVNQIKSSKDFMKGLLNVLPFNTGDVTVNP